MSSSTKKVQRKKVRIACEESQVVCIAMRKKGYEAFSCDILPYSGGHPLLTLPVKQNKDE